MRMLVVGAGATGGYFGGRLAAAGRDVTFLVRPRRAEQLRTDGLRIVSPSGNAEVRHPAFVEVGAAMSPFDVVILSCKAYDLDDAMTAVAPAVGPDTLILPLLNGMRHLDALDARFGAGSVLGGLCLISSVLDPSGTIVHLNEPHAITFGARAGSQSARVAAIHAALAGAGFDARASDAILQEMWDKWVLIAPGAALTCLMRASVGDVVAVGAGSVAEMLLEECAAIAGSAGYPPSDAVRQRTRSLLTRPGSSLTASMLRDMERGGRTEVEQILGDLLARRRGTAPERSLLQLACWHVRAYEARRARGQS